jgi:hypothetical protein
MCELFVAAHHENLPIVISVIALVISVGSLVWNIYREILLKPRMRVRFWFSQIIMPARVTAPFLKLSVLNLGPGSNTVVGARVRVRPFFLSWFREENPATAIHNFNDPFCATLPAKMAPGETIMITFPIEGNRILDPKVLRIGIEDSFNRFHWAPRKDLKRARRRIS